MRFFSSGNSSRKDADATQLETAIIHTVAYVDLFDYPVTAREIHRYLAGMAAPPEAVRTFLNNGRLDGSQLSKS